MIEIQLLKSPGCGSCEQVTRIWERIQHEYPEFRLVTVDITTLPATVARYGLMAVPGLVVDGILEAEGLITERDFRQVLDKHRDRKKRSVHTVRERK